MKVWNYQLLSKIIKCQHDEFPLDYVICITTYDDRKLHTSWPAITTTNTHESPEADVSLIHGNYSPINLSTSIYGTS